MDFVAPIDFTRQCSDRFDSAHPQVIRETMFVMLVPLVPWESIAKTMGFCSRETAEQPRYNALSLMDECKSMNGYGYREVLVMAVLACCAQVSAADPGQDELRNFLEDGWGRSASPQQPDHSEVVPDPVSSSVPPVVLGPVAPLMPPGTLMRSPVLQDRVAIESESGAATSADSDQTSRDDLMTRDPQQGPGFQSLPSFETLQIDRAPSVKRLMVGRPSKAVRNREPVSGDSGVISAADPIDADQLAVRIPRTEREQECESKYETYDLVDVSDAGSTVSTNSDLTTLPPSAQVEMTKAGQGLPVGKDVAAFFRGVRQPVQDGQVPVGEELFELPSVELPLPGQRGEVPDQPATLGVTAEGDRVAGMDPPCGLIEEPLVESEDALSRAAGYWELAEQSLQQARDATSNKIASEARTSAFDAFRLCVVAIDAADETDRSAQCFQMAVQAIRESEDFCKSSDGISPSELNQLISTHQTSVMKGVSPSELSSHDAAFRYMTFARRKLIEAASGIPEASEALMLLGAAEAESTVGSATYKHAIAVMLQRAAIEINPANHETHLALGKTLSKQGLSEQACWSLQRSVEIRPTRDAYQILLEIATHSGNDEQRRVYLAELQRFPQMTGRFAAKSNAPVNGETALAPSGPDPEKLKAEAARLSWRSLIPFMR